MDTVRFLCNTPFVIVITLMLCLIYYFTGVPPNPKDVIGVGLQDVFDKVHSWIIPIALGYWIIAFFVRKLPD